MPGQRLSAAGGRFRVSVPASPLVALIAAAAWTTLVRLPLLQRHGADDAFYTEVALLWRQGVLPYVGAFDIKPPGIFAVLAVAQALLKSNLAALNAVSIASDALTAGLVMILGRRYGQPIVGVAAAAMYPILSETVVFGPRLQSRWRQNDDAGGFRRADGEDVARQGHARRPDDRRGLRDQTHGGI